MEDTGYSIRMSIWIVTSVSFQWDEAAASG